MRCHAACLLALVLSGCDAPVPPTPPTGAESLPVPPQRAPVVGRRTLTGRVTWDGPIPQVAPVTTFRTRIGKPAEIITRPAPNAPAIDPATRGIAGAVVWLRGVDPSAARPWDHGLVMIELHDERPLIRQGDVPPDNVGFVRRGDPVRFVSVQPRFHALRARGAAFWTLTLPDPDRMRTRRFERVGRVDLTSAAGDFWVQGHLFVDDHPCYTRTDAEGRWTLPEVPPGTYDLVAWLPPWQVANAERDPETAAVVRWQMAPGIEQVRQVRIAETEPTSIDITFKQ